MKHALLIAARDLASLFLTPVAYVVGVLFLALQGFSFWALATVLSDPRQNVGYGAVLRTHFGGTILYWAVLFLVIAVVSMRLCAEERRQGTWESLLSVPVTEGEVVVGKWLAGLGFYGFLWLPTLLFPIALRFFAPPEASFELAPIATAYLGVFLCGAAFLAVGVAVSAATDNQLLAAVVTFSIGMGWLFAGQLSDLGTTTPSALAVLDLRAHMDSFARGAVPLSALVLFLGLTAVGLFAADAVAIVGRRAGKTVRARWLTVALSTALLVAGLAAAARQSYELDFTSSRQNRLEDRTLEVLAGSDALTATLIRPASEAFAPIFTEVERLVRRMARAQPRLTVRTLDAALEPEKVAALATEFALAPAEIADGGAVLLEIGSRRRVIEVLDMAEFGKDALGAGAMVAFRAEGALTQAIAAMMGARAAVLCAATSHGELALEKTAGPDWRFLADALRGEGMTIRPLAALDDLAGCDALLILGPRQPLVFVEAAAVATYLEQGGRLFLALSSRPEEGFVDSGLEAALGAYGFVTPRAIVIDPDNDIGIPLAWQTTDGYGEHAISRGFQNRRLSVWLAPRAVTGGESLVRPGAGGWGERDSAGLARGEPQSAGDGDFLGAPAVAQVAEKGNSRVVVFGSAESLSSLLVDRGMTGAALLARTSISWLLGRAVSAEAPKKSVERVRLVMTESQRQLLFALTVLFLPATLALFGAGVFVRRRR